jgi:DNA-binding NarL/FixJ family response regulator
VHVLITRGDTAQASGWTARNMRLLAGLPATSVAHGYRLAMESFRAAAIDRDYQHAVTAAGEAIELGRRGGDLDLVALALNNGGRALIRSGDIETGLSWFDEAMVSVVSGELSPLVAGTVYCSLLEACDEIVELPRAREWTVALTRWCESQQGIVTFNGQCLTHRSLVLRRHGEWDQAASEAARACEVFQGAADEAATGRAHYQLAEVLRVRGDLPAAEDHYRRAGEWGHDPQPGLALLRLAQGRIDDAAGAMRRIAAETTDTVERIGLLPAYVEVMLAAGDVARAAKGAQELADVAATFATAALRAEADYAEGSVALARGALEAALGPLRASCAAWLSLETPYEAARCRLLMSRACDALGDHDTATLERDAARRTLASLGAGDVLATPDTDTFGLTSRELEVLGLVATGMTNQQIADELFIAVKTVDRHVANILTKLDVGTRTAAAAFAYEHRLA